MAGTVAGLMGLLAEATGWGDQSLSVSIGYKRAKRYVAPDETEMLDEWGFTVSTNVCGMQTEVHAQGKTLEEALLNLAKAIPLALQKKASLFDAAGVKARNAIERF